MRNAQNLTPKEAAQMIAIQAVRDEWRLYERKHQEVEGTPAFKRKTLDQLAKIHNRLLEESGFDGMLLPVAEDKQR